MKKRIFTVLAVLLTLTMAVSGISVFGAEAGGSSASKSVKALNSIKETSAYQESLRDILDKCYKDKDTKKIKEVAASVDSRGKAIVQNYKAAAAERSKAKKLDYLTGEVIVTVDNSVSKSEINEMADDQRGDCQYVTELSNDKKIAVMDISDEYTVAKAVAEYEGESGVVAVQPNYLYKKAEAAKPNDTYYKKQWYIDFIKARDAWDTVDNVSGDKVKLAVIDVGVDVYHEDLQQAVDMDLSGKTKDGKVIRSTLAAEGHGTHVAGIIGAQKNNSEGIAGVASGKDDGITDIISINAGTTLSFFGENITLFTSADLITAINYAKDKGAKLINMSLGGASYDAAMEVAIDNAYKAGVLTICAAGNESTDLLNTPSDFPNVISVTSMNKFKTANEFSNYGWAKDISAPGDSIFSTYKPDDFYDTEYASVSGTSMAAPMVTGVAAMMLYVDPDLTPRQIKNIIYGTAEDTADTGYDQYTGYGKIDADKAVKAASDAKGVTIPATALAFNRDGVTTYVGQTSAVEYTTVPANATGNATWSSSNTAIASVDANGKVTAKAVGKATITVTQDGKSDSYTLTVKDPYQYKISAQPYSKIGKYSIDSPMSSQIPLDGYEGVKTYMGGYSFYAAKGTTVEIVHQAYGSAYSEDEDSEIDTVLMLLDSNKKIIKCVDDYETYDDESYDAYIKYKVPKSGTYYLQAAAAFNVYGQYKISMSSDKSKSTLKAKKASKNTAKLSWSKKTGATGYQIYRSTKAKKGFKKIATVKKSKIVTYKDKKLKKGKTYYYKVRAYNSTSIKNLCNAFSSVKKVKM